MADAAVLVFDVIQNILLRLDVEDLLRFKSVCKLWYSLISSKFFVNAHLNHNHHINPDLRIHTLTRLGITDRNFCYSEIVGSSNGLVCISSFSVEFCVINPATREHKALPTLPFKGPWSELHVGCWGFGYDSSTDDYKVVVGTKVGDHRIRFQVLTLKSTTWRFIGELNYKYTPAFGYGCSLNGAMHWLIEDLHSNHNSNNNIVILSFDFSQENFKEIPQPDDTRYVCDYQCCLAISKECLVVFPIVLRPIWVMKKYDDKNSWQMLQDKDLRHSCDVYFLNCFPYNGWRFCDIKGNMCHDRSFNPCLNECGIGHGAPTFVKSLVSPHRYGKPKKKNKRSLKLDSSYHVISSSFFFKNTMRNNKRKRYKKNK